MEYGYCIAVTKNAWRVRLLSDGVESDHRRYPYHDDESCKRAYEQAMLIGHLHVMANLFLPMFPDACDPILEQAIQSILSDTTTTLQ